MVGCVTNFYSERCGFKFGSGEMYLKEVRIMKMVFCFVFFISSFMHLRPGCLKLSSSFFFFGKTITFLERLEIFTGEKERKLPYSQVRENVHLNTGCPWRVFRKCLIFSVVYEFLT